ncbi:hypothetical protein O181_020461 [Austropuccinia psidii MF-1]|uniref:S-methyl-5-thioribose-1-phosphate isomerase n=1 Tax=Austropuccinia psidii MF-1 TaxID=1389203 RepID=A0A9Q3GUU6_9BASI|nr:hypothetical protein [Austropuccinia psidii MF-1]
MSENLVSIRLLDGSPIQETHSVEIIDQLLLPHQIKWITIQNPAQAYQAIKAMKIRGAPAIGSLAALSIACGLLRYSTENPKLSISEIGSFLDYNSKLLISARPTAVNLQEAIHRINSAFQATTQSNHSVDQLLPYLVKICESVWQEDLARNHKIGKGGARWLLDLPHFRGKHKLSILTVCNTGSLATAGYGTALGIITALHELDRLEHVYYMQTTPYLQGARLTSLELQLLNISSTMVCDSATAWLINSGKIDAFIAGADRIASNGDTANKISTFQIALLCKHAKPSAKPSIPVIIAAPLTTLDLTMKDGSTIEIEQRPSLEACTVQGKVLAPQSDGGLQFATIMVTPENIQALNPAFDVTPAELIDGVVTELGVAEKPSGSKQFDLKAHASQSTSTSITN